MTSAININVDSELKKQATEILNGLGLNMSTFINMALIQVVNENGIPFEVKNPKPSRKLRRALKEADKIAKHPEKYKGYNDIDELFKDLDS
ncbi:MAG: type II toxin-antitoxin system RelB/DinJ family antitoxin [Bacilli bacterium]|nr:type II toxin-antitoxin system RelB/DinJ family antitoxin [Bacilli bacterium]